MKIKKKNFEIFYKNHHPIRHIKYKVINFAPSNTSIMAIELPSTNLKKISNTD